MIYAQLGPDMICDAVVQSAGELTAPEGKIFMPLPTYDPSVSGKRWNGTAFEAVEVEP